MSTALVSTEAMSIDGAIRVCLGGDGRTLWVGLSSAATRFSAAELASGIVRVNTLAYMTVQVSRGCRTRDELDAYAGFVAMRCDAGLRRRTADFEPRLTASSPSPAEDRDDLGQRVRARVKHIETLLEGASANVKWTGGDGDVVVEVDPSGRLAGLWLSPRCTTHRSAVELESLLNRVLAAIGAATHPESNGLRDAS